jgi:hypothetical protein
LNKKASGVKKDVEMSDEENDVFVGNVDTGTGVVFAINVVGAVHFTVLGDSSKSFFLKKSFHEIRILNFFCFYF